MNIIPNEMVRRAQFLAVLDTMWGDSGDSIPWFAINPYNWSGKRLYKLTGAKFPAVWVTNACAEQVDSPSGRGTPNPEWLRRNLMALPASLAVLPLLVCGRRAQPTFATSGYSHCGPVHLLKHPAARSWTNDEIAATIVQLTK